MKHTLIALFSALLVLAFTPSAEAKDKHKKHHDDHRRHDHDRYSHYDHNRGHHYGYDRHHGHRRSVYHAGHYTWRNHHRVWVPPYTVVVYM